MSGIVVGYNGSENAEAALIWAMERAVTEHRALTILTVNEVAVNPYTGSPSEVPADNVLLEKARGMAGQTAERLSRNFSPAPHVVVKALTGLVGEELVLASEDADMLVIGSSGQREFPALRVSNVATKIAHYASCPVVLVPPAT